MQRREEQLVGRRRIGEARRLLLRLLLMRLVSLLSFRGVAAVVGLFVAAVSCVVVVLLHYIVENASIYICPI
jgi:hypothetical protein